MYLTLTNYHLLVLLLASTLLTVSCEGEKGRKVLMCYFAEWSAGREKAGAFRISNVDPHLCTHFVYAYVGMQEDTYQIYSREPFFSYEMNGIGMMAEAVELKKKNPDLKVLVSCGGWSEGSVRYSKMAASPDSRKIFVKSVVDFLKKYKFDGLDFAWEYPADRGGEPHDKENHATLLEELRSEFDRSNYLLTIQMMGQRFIVDPGYNLARVSKAVDYISYVVYQFHYPGELVTGINSPLKSSDDLNVEFSLNYILKKGVPPEKLLLGLATYGHPFIMDRDVTNDNYVGVPAGVTYPGPWSKESGFIGFNEACYEITSGTGWKELWHTESRTPIAVNGRKFMSYDNKRSFKEKVKLVTEKGLAGAFIWSIDTDDFKGICYGETYPLISQVKDYFDKKYTGTWNEFNITVVSHEYAKAPGQPYFGTP